MPAKQKFGSRRKNTIPRRVVRADDDHEVCDNTTNTITLPKDPKALAEFIVEKPISDFYQMPTVPAVFFDIVQQARDNAVPGEEPVFDCIACNQKSYRSVGGLQYHLMHTCESVSEPTFTCLICQEGFLDVDKIVEHVQDAHVRAFLGTSVCDAVSRRAARSTRMKIQMFAENSVVSEGVETANPSTSDFEDEPQFEDVPEEKDPSPKPSPYTRKPDSRRRKSVKSASLGGALTYTSINRPLAEAFEWTYNGKKEMEKKFPLIHTHIQPLIQNWTEIDNTTLHKTYKLYKVSPPFAIDTDLLNSPQNKKATSKSQSKNLNDELKRPRSSCNGSAKLDQKTKKSVLKNCNFTYQKLKTFQCLETEMRQKCTFYVGAPVWSMDWCPCSITDAAASDQYLSLSTHQGEHLLEPDVTYNEDVIVQLWNCGKLHAKPSEDQLKDEPPSLAYGIALSSGPVWSMQWCPLAESILNLATQYERLGLLALACASGQVYVYAMPKPCDRGSLPKSSDSKQPPGAGKIYRANPTYILEPLRSGTFGQCLCVSWSYDDGCNFLAAGFSSGHIALWELNTTSELLLSRENDTQTLLAFHSFRAHSKPVRDVAWCPFNSNIFVSVGADRCLKIWDQRNTEVEMPHFLPAKMSVIHEINWPLIWCGVYAASDSVFSIPYFHGCLLLNVGSSSNPLQSVVPFKSASWTVTSSNWLNSTATGDIAGNVVLKTCNNWNRLYITNKRYPRMLISQTEVEWTEEGASTEYLENERKFDQDAEHSYRLILHDSNMSDDLSGWKDLEAHKRARTFEDFTDECYSLPVGAIHKVRWNPNMSSFTWVASGNYAGLVRLHCLSGLLSREVQRTWSKCSNK